MKTNKKKQNTLSPGATVQNMQLLQIFRPQKGFFMLLLTSLIHFTHFSLHIFPVFLWIRPAETTTIHQEMKWHIRPQQPAREAAALQGFGLSWYASWQRWCVAAGLRLCNWEPVWTESALRRRFTLIRPPRVKLSISASLRPFFVVCFQFSWRHFFLFSKEDKRWRGGEGGWGWQGGLWDY